MGMVGLLACIAPRVVLALHSKINLLGFQNTEHIEPSDWLVTLTRVAGLLAVTVAILSSESDGQPSEDDGIDYV